VIFRAYCDFLLAFSASIYAFVFLSFFFILYIFLIPIRPSQASQNVTQYIEYYLLLTARRKACKLLYMLQHIRLSACLSDTLRYCVKTRERRGMRSSSSGSPVSLVFWCQE